MDLGPPTQSHVQQKAGIARESIGLHGFTLDQTGIAKRSFLAGRTAVHQGDLKTALLQMQGGAGTDHAGTQNKDGGRHDISNHVACVNGKRAAKTGLALDVSSIETVRGPPTTGLRRMMLPFSVFKLFE
jgi:hypothetical protein